MKQSSIRDVILDHMTGEGYITSTAHCDFVCECGEQFKGPDGALRWANHVARQIKRLSDGSAAKEGGRK